MDADTWEEIGVISHEPETKNRKPASYRAYETIVPLHGIIYRALVVHSDAHDERRRKRVDKQIAKEWEELTKLKKSLEKIEYCLSSDAQAAADRIRPATLHRLVVEILPRPQYGKGRPKADEPERSRP